MIRLMKTFEDPFQNSDSKNFTHTEIFLQESDNFEENEEVIDASEANN